MPQFQHLRVDHAAAEDLEPVAAGADLQFAAFARAADIEIGRGLGDGSSSGGSGNCRSSRPKKARENSIRQPFRLPIHPPEQGDGLRSLAVRGSLRGSRRRDAQEEAGRHNRITRERATPRPQNVANLMEGLRRSIAQEATPTPPRRGASGLRQQGENTVSHLKQEGQASHSKAGRASKRSSGERGLTPCGHF